MNRAQRRQAKRNAAKVAEGLIAGRVHQKSASGYVERITHPGTLRLMQRIAEQALRLNSDVVLAPVRDREIARVLTSSMPDGARAYVGASVDRDGRLAWTADWVAGDLDRERERERMFAEAHLLPRLGDWCRTRYLGDLEPRGRA